MSKPTVTLTLAGDADKLDRVFAETGQAADKMEAQLKAAAAGSDAAFSGSSDRIRESTTRTRKAFDDTAESSKRFDEVGERFDQLDTRAMGFRDGVTGAQDSMTSLASFARGDFQNGLLYAGSGLSDLGSSMYNSVIPSIKQTVTTMGALKLALVGGAVAAAAVGVALLIAQNNANKFSVDMTHAQEDLERFLKTSKQTETIRAFAQSTDDWAESLRLASQSYVDLAVNKNQSDTFWKTITGQATAAKDRFKDLDQAVSEYVDTTNDAAGAQRILLSTGLTPAQIEAAKAAGQFDGLEAALARTEERTWDVVDATQASTDAYKGYADQIRAQTDPLFALTKAQADVTSAQKDYTDAVREFGPTSQEARDAQDKLAQAELGVLDATTKVSNVDLSWYESLYQQGQISATALAAIERNANNAKDALGRLNGTSIGIYINAYSNNQALLDRALSGYYSDYGSYVAGLSGARAAGGPVMAFGDYLVGEDGPEILHMGAMSGTVIPNGAIGSAGGTTINHIYVQGLVELQRFLDWQASLRNQSQRGVMVR